MRHRLDPDLAASAARADRVDAEVQGAGKASAAEGDQGSTAAAAERPAVGEAARRPFARRSTPALTAGQLALSDWRLPS